MRVARITESAEIGSLADGWNCLTRANPLRSWQWLATWWKYYGGDRELYVLAVYNDDNLLVGLAPLFREQRGSTGQVLQWLGAGDVCTDYMTILTSHEYEQSAISTLSDWLVDHSNDPDHGWDLIELEGVAENDTSLTSFIALLDEKGCATHCRKDLCCWRLPLAESWESFLASMSKSRRKKIKKWQRALTENPSLSVHRARNEDELTNGMRSFVDLHQRRRTSLGEPGCFACDTFTGFLHESAHRLFATEMLELFWLEHIGRPVAAEFDLVDGDTIYGYQSGIDPEALQYSPGNLLGTAIMRHGIETERTTYDFLRGNERYKQWWKATPLQLLHFRIAANRVGPQIRQGVWTAGVAVKSWVKGGLNLAGM